MESGYWFHDHFQDKILDINYPDSSESYYNKIYKDIVSTPSDDTILTVKKVNALFISFV